MEETGSTGTNAESLSPHKRRTTAVVKLLERIKSTLPAELEGYDEAALSVRMDDVEQLNRTFEEAQSRFEESEASSLDCIDRMTFTSLYFDVKSALTRKRLGFEANGSSSTLRQFSVDEPPSCNQAPMLRKTKLPEIQLPKFNGSYTDWPNFFALFSTVVNDNDELSDLEKFHHLRSSLSDAALDTIASLELNKTNYKEAVTLLKNRFDNKLQNFQTHIKDIFALKAVGTDKTIPLRHVSDKINSHLRALQTLGSKEQIADGLLIHLIVTKIDENSRIKWEEQLSINELPTWDSLSAFLERRCRLLENIASSSGNKSSKQQQSKKPGQQNSFVHVSSETSASCALCESKEHIITKCNQFESLSPVLRFQEAKRLKLCLNCLRKGHILKKCSSGTCRKCSSKHHTMLHVENTSAEQPSTQSRDSLSHLTMQSTDSTIQAASQAVLVSSSEFAVDSKPSVRSVLLATALILVKSQSGTFLPCRAILDSASQLNLITSQFANRLRLKFHRAYSSISGIGDGNLHVDKAADVEIKSIYGDFSTAFTAMVISSITDYRPSIHLKPSEWKIPKNIQLADPSFDKGNRIDILIGAELFFDLMSVGQIKLSPNLPVLQKTLLGWVIAGGAGIRSHHSWSLAAICSDQQKQEDLSSILRSFWEIEGSFLTTDPQINEDLFCEQHFMTNTARLSSGAYSVRLPQIESNGVSSLGDSYQRALQRFLGLEKRIKRYPEMKEQYVAFMREYASLNHLSLVSSQVQQKQYFMPHHCVHKPDSTSTKLRVVFDGSAKTTTGYSLNDVLHSGPTIQPKLFNTLLRYRCFRIVLSGDICKMYRCVKVSHPDDYLQCVLWREKTSEEIKAYKLNTVTYGTKPAAFLAIRAMHQLATDEGAHFPLGAKILQRDFYVDDMLTGGDSVSEVLQIRHQVANLLRRGEFVIRKWCSNEPAVLDDVPVDEQEQFLKFQNETNVTKTLGLVWDPKGDNFIFSFTPAETTTRLTKRSILSWIARLYDPLGLIGPVITKAKIFMQYLWKLSLQWDESLPQCTESSWIEYTSKFKSIPFFTFPRFVSLPASEVQIHAFCDASLAAYGACIYVRSDTGNDVRVFLLCSKSRVSPLKTLTVPKLELSAAHLLAELVDNVVKTLPYDCDVYCWSDSMVALSWIRQYPSHFNVFVSNRVTRIQALTSQSSWRYVPTNHNPADVLSRGATPQELINHPIWTCGPNFLHLEPEHWPANPEILENLPERRRNILLTIALVDLSMLCKYHNSFQKMQRVFAYVAKFLRSKSRDAREELTLNDIELGTRLLVRNIQLVQFAAEYKTLKSSKMVAASSKLHALSPILDSFGIIRVGGRLQHSNLDYDAQHPIILPKQHPFTTATVLHFHNKLLHAGPQSLLAAIRQQYWPIGGRKHISSIISKCLRCFRMKPMLSKHIMGALPADRVRPSRAFHTTGVDFCGPFYYKSEIRNRPPIKCYISIFVCFSTKASHLEVVQDLSTASFLSALRRFIATRGKPRTIWSDNATIFVGAKNELLELKQLFLSQSHVQHLQNQCFEDGINWKFIPPRSPHFGGLWEAAVKVAKFHYQRTVGLHVLTFDELRTLTCQIAAIMNSRPLCPLSEDPDDLNVLTPGHFLVGGPLVSIAEPDLTEIDINRLNRWQRISQMEQIFWKKWSHGYLSLLQERSKWRTDSGNISQGALVVVKDENSPPLKWPLARVLQLIHGKDGVARVAVIRTSNDTIKRAVSKLAVLPIGDSVETPSTSTVGGCSQQNQPCAESSPVQLNHTDI